MKVIKDKYIKFPSLEDSIARLGANLNESPNQAVSLSDFEMTPAEQQKRIRFYFVISKLNNKLQETDDLQTVLHYLHNSLKEIISIKQSFLYLFDSAQVLKPVIKSTEAAYTSFFNKAYKNGILDWMFETGNISALPDITKPKSGANSLNLIVLPLFKNKKPYGIYAVVSPIGALSTKSFESEALKIFLSLVQNKIDLAQQRDVLASAYEDIQVLQSKLSNDFKFSAIGELTAGIVEDVMSPVQVILSCANYLEKEYDNIDKKITGVIVSQIRKVETVIKRLSKFVGNQPTGNNLYPCVINDPLRDYYDVVLSSLRYRNYECILDLDESLPPILSRKTYIHQILTNLFGLVINSKVEGGGILVQTKFINNFITLRFIVTDRLDLYSENDDSNKTNLNLKMISNIMKRHQGQVNIDNNDSGGTSIVLNFPIKRNLSK